MGIRIDNRINAGQRDLGAIGERRRGNLARLASGSRIASAADDAAGLGVSERLRSEIQALSALGRNAQDGISLVQTADAALDEVAGSLTRMRELAVAARNGTLGDADRQALDREFQELAQGISNAARTTRFNGIALLDGSESSVEVQVGAENGEVVELELADVRADEGLGLADASLATSSGAGSALAALDDALASVARSRAELGATEDRLSSAARSIATERESLSQSESRIRDTDVALETSELVRNDILVQAGAAVRAQANVQARLALRLLETPA
jgi:flagellin